MKKNKSLTIHIPKEQHRWLLDRARKSHGSVASEVRKIFADLIRGDKNGA